MTDRTYDSRYVYGFCTWHDSIHKAGSTGAQKMIVNGREIKSLGLPCCPYCGSMLMEVSHKKEWDKSVEKHDAEFPGYKEFIDWSQGKCFPNIDFALEVYNKQTGHSFTGESFGFKKPPEKEVKE